MSKPVIITNEELAKKLYSSRDLDHLVNVEKRSSLSVGIPSIDKDFPFVAGFYVICANPGAGKSWFALWLSRRFYERDGMQSVYFSLEMPEAAVRTRILQQWSDLTKTQLQSGFDTSKAVNLLRDDVMVVDEFYVTETSLQTPRNFYEWVKSYYAIGYRVFHFDHLHELDGANDNKQNQGVTEAWARAFQFTVKKFPDIWLFVYAQPNGAAASKKIIKRTDISGSKAITQKCDFFFSLNREMKEDAEILTIDEESRTVYLYLDKTRYTEKAHIAFKLYFSLTGNFYSTTRDEEK